MWTIEEGNTEGTLQNNDLCIGRFMFLSHKLQINAIDRFLVVVFYNRLVCLHFILR